MSWCDISFFLYLENVWMFVKIQNICHYILTFLTIIKHFHYINFSKRNDFNNLSLSWCDHQLVKFELNFMFLKKNLLLSIIAVSMIMILIKIMSKLV